MTRPMLDERVYGGAGEEMALGVERFVADPSVQFESGLRYFINIAPLVVIALCFLNCICAEVGAMARNFFCWGCSRR